MLGTIFAQKHHAKRHGIGFLTGKTDNVRAFLDGFGVRLANRIVDIAQLHRISYYHDTAKLTPWEW